MVTILIAVGVVTVGLLLYAKNAPTAEAPQHCCQETEEGGSMKLTFGQLFTLAQNAGFGDDSQTAAAIALAESGGDPTAYNPETQACTPDGQGSYGLWQIYRKAHPEFECMDLTQPEQNAAAAFSVYATANGFHPWSTFKSGAYQKYLPA